MVSEVGQSLAQWSAAGWPWLVNHLWQSTIFASVLLAAVAFLRRAPARLRYSLSLLASLKFAIPAALVAALVGWTLPGAAAWLPALGMPGLDLSALAAGLVPSEVGFLGLTVVSVSGALLFVWLVGAVTLLGRWMKRTRALSALVAEGREVTSGPAFELLERARVRAGVGRRVRLVLLPSAVEPGVFRVFCPVLVLPAPMLAELGPEELEAIFLHELTHVGRWDNLIASLHMFLCCLFWFHPLVWWLDRRLLREREEACDERVLALGGKADAYAKGLLKVVRFGLGWRLAGVSGASSSDFRQRIERILLRSSCPVRQSAGERLSFAVAFALLVGFSWIAAGTASVRSAGPELNQPSALALGVQPPAGVQEKCLRSTSAVRNTGMTDHLAALSPAGSERPTKARPGTACTKSKKPKTSTAAERLVVARKAEPESRDGAAGAEAVVVGVPVPEPVH